MNLDTLRRLAGINEFQGYSEYKIDENPSITAASIKKKDGLNYGSVNLI